MYFWPSGPLTKPAYYGFSRFSNICNRFWTFVANESSVISKMVFNNSVVSTIIIRGVKVISCIWSCDHLCGTLEHRAHFLSSSSFSSPLPPPLPLSASSRAWGQTLHHRRANVSLSNTRQGCHNDLIIINLLIGLKCLFNAKSSSILSSQRDVSSSCSSPRFPSIFYMFAHINHVRLWQSINNN